MGPKTAIGGVALMLLGVGIPAVFKIEWGWGGVLCFIGLVLLIISCQGWLFGRHPSELNLSRSTIMSAPIDNGITGRPQLVMDFPRGLSDIAMSDRDFWILRNVGGRAATRIRIQEARIGDWVFQFEPIAAIGPSGHGADVATVEYTSHKGSTFWGSNKQGYTNPAHGLKSALASECDLLNGPVLPLTINYRDDQREECTKQVIHYGTFDVISVLPEDCRSNQPSSPDQKTLEAFQKLLPNEGGIMHLRTREQIFKWDTSADQALAKFLRLNAGAHNGFLDEDLENLRVKLQEHIKTLLDRAYRYTDDAPKGQVRPFTYYGDKDIATYDKNRNEVIELTQAVVQIYDDLILTARRKFARDSKT